MTRLNIVALVIATLAACTADGTDRQDSSARALSQTDMQSISDAMASLDVAYSNEDLLEALRHFTEDVVHLPPGEPLVVGLADVRKRDSTYLSNFDVDLKSTVEEIGGAGEFGYALYTYTESGTPRTGGETTSARGKGIGLFRKGSDGSWKLTHFVWNLDEPR